ncbi:MAG: dihydropyrimidinase, partial [Bosea sp. (in: a-proteobacteria)]
IKGWPETVLRRGEVIVAGGKLMANPGSGKLLLREAGPATKPTGRLSPEFDPAQNFGADLY